MSQKRSVFFILAVLMIGFGILTGLIFPFLSSALGMPISKALSPIFFSACVTAGILVGVVNILLAKFTVGEKLRLFTSKMDHAKENILRISRGGDLNECSVETCHIPVESDDEFGHCGAAFNELIEAFAAVLKTQEAIRSHTEILSSQLALDGLAENALEVIMQHGGASAGAILTCSEEQILTVACHGIEDIDSLQSSQVLKRVINNKLVELIEYPKDLVVQSMLVEYQPRQVLAYPIIYKELVLGILVLATPNEFASEFLKEIDIFAHSLALSLNNALEHEELQRIAEKDPLTNTYNRRAGLNRYEKEYQKALKTNHPFSALMIDIDHFKKVNDTHGHLIGDSVLKRVADSVKQELRERDFLVRYGGEEFLLVLPETDCLEAQELAEQLRSRFAKETIVVEGASISISISIGCGTSDGFRTKSGTSFIKDIDIALYQAKESGRNRVILA